IGYFCEERYFVYMAGFGAFTEVSYQTTQEKKNLLGHQAYMIEGVKSLANLKAYRMKIEAEDFSLEGDFLFGMITNTISVGGFKGLVTRDVALNDGLFEVLMIRMPKTPIEFSSIVSYLFLKEEQNEFVYKFKTSRLHILSEEPIDWVLDGEFGGTRTEVEVVNLSKQIEIMTGFVKKS
ncbi:MAG: diacylglycerol kinase family lipid kinase, partial [Hungatella sp.]